MPLKLPQPKQANRIFLFGSLSGKDFSGKLDRQMQKRLPVFIFQPQSQAIPH